MQRGGSRGPRSERPSSENEIQAASTRASDYFVNGCHCAASASTVLEALGEEEREAAAHATAFGGGIC